MPRKKKLPASEPIEPDAPVNLESEHSAEVITPQNGQHEKQPSTRSVGQRTHRYAQIYWARKWLTIPLSLITLILVLAAVPLTRYSVLGLVVKQDVVVTVVDSKLGTPVSKASVVFGNTKVLTSATGVAKFRVPVGYQKVSVDKQYYQTYDNSRLITLSSSGNQVRITLVAIGRLVPVSITNKFTGKPLSGATVKVLKSDVLTDTSGKATIVVPATATDQQFTVAANGYNSLTTSVSLQGQSSVTPFALTPAGKVYFLSNLSGTIDVVKTNLDGSDRQTVLAGTGFEDKNDTVLLASKDWKFLALYAIRKQGGSPEIDLIDTSNDHMTNIDEGNASFTLVGWDGDDFIYEVDRSAVQVWQNGQQVLKSFDATTKAIKALASTTAAGLGTWSYVAQQMSSAYIVNNKVVYAIGWEAPYDNSGNELQLSSKQVTLNAVNPDGTGDTVLKTFGPTGALESDLQIDLESYDQPNSLAIAFDHGFNGPTFYEYQNGQVASTDELNDQNFYGYNNTYPTFLDSPSGKGDLWSVYADGKNNLTVGDNNGQHAKTIAVESDYSPYGWYTDNYLLVQKSGSELYIMPSDGTGQPFKITNYYKPQVTYRGYGGGYGGL